MRKCERIQGQLAGQVKITQKPLLEAEVLSILLSDWHQNFGII